MSTSIPLPVAAPEVAALRGTDECGAHAPRDGGGAAAARTAIMAPSARASSYTTSGTGSGAASGSPSKSTTTSSGTPSGVRGSLSRAGPRVTPIAASTAAVPMAEAAMPIVVAAPEGEDLGKKCNQRMKPHWKKKEKKRETKWDKSRFPNTPVGTFGWWGGAAWSHSPLGLGH
jgi:hypothetical protein